MAKFATYRAWAAVWTVRWSMSAPTTFGNVWSASMSQPDQTHLVASNVFYNTAIPTGRVGLEILTRRAGRILGQRRSGSGQLIVS